MKIRQLLILVSMLVSLLPGCRAPGEGRAGPQVLARVGDKELTVETLEKALDVLYPPDRARPNGVERDVLQRLIETELLVTAARARGLERDFEVQSEVALKERDLLFDELYRRGIIDPSPEVTREQAEYYFDRYDFGEQRRLSRILVSDGEAVDQVRMRVEAGEDFAELARELSEDPTAQMGGDLGWRNRLSFKGYPLMRLVFRAAPGQLVGPVDEGSGYAWYMVTDVRRVPIESVAAQVQRAATAEKRTLATLRYLEDLADRAHVRDHDDALRLLFSRLTEAGRETPQLRKDEGSAVLLSTAGDSWTIDQFMSAMRTETGRLAADSVEDLRFYARRLYAIRNLLQKRTEELGLGDTEHVRKGRDRAMREALVDRLREVEVTEKIDPPESLVRQYYEEHRDRYAVKDRVSIQEVLVERRAQADSLLQQLEEGADLADLAKRYTMRSPRIRRAEGRILLLRPDKYGRVGWEAQDAEVGEIVGPVKTEQGYSVFKVLRKISGHQTSFERARVRAARHLRRELADQKFEEFLRRLQEKYQDRVIIYEDHLEAYLGEGQALEWLPAVTPRDFS